MSFLSRLFKRKENKQVVEKTEGGTELTDFEKFFNDTPEISEALKETMFLDPRKIDISIKDVVSKAKEMEKAKNPLRAAMWYRIAGGLAIYEGDSSKVLEYFGKYAKLTGRQLKILQIADEAVKKAQEYYKKYLKE